MRRLRICFAIPNFDRLGAQRVAIWVAKALPRERFDISFLVHQAGGEMMGELPKEIPVHVVDTRCPSLPKAMSLSRPLGYLRWLRELCPDVVVGVVQYPTFATAAVLGMLHPAPALIACEHSFVSKNIVDPDAYPYVFRRIYRQLFPVVYNRRCTAVVVTAEEGRRDLVENWGIDDRKLHVIPNPIDHKALHARADESLEDAWFAGAPVREGNASRLPVVVAAGRLTFQKRFDILVDAFAHVRKKMRANLLILGAGGWDKKLQRQVTSLGLQDCVRIENQSPPWRHMVRADLFVLSSEWEGFPMVLAEAMALACPIVSVRCPSGPSEMLDEGRGGWLVPPNDPVALGDGIVEALRAPEEAKRRATYAAKKSADYAAAAVAGRYATLFESVVTGR
jgi:glycosyltransferase involved in cell wall biosynthesis